VGGITHHQEWNVVLVDVNARIRAADLDRVTVTRGRERPATKQGNKNTPMACSIHILLFLNRFLLSSQRRFAGTSVWPSLQPRPPDSDVVSDGANSVRVQRVTMCIG
jgi:peptide methionine sulfoxide reductase MsrB